MIHNNPNLVKKLFLYQGLLLVGIVLGPMLRKQFIMLFPQYGSLFRNQIKKQNYFQQKFIFSYLKLNKIEFTPIKVVDNIFYLDGIVFLDNPTNLKCLAPIIQYKIIWTDENNKNSIILDQNFYKMNSVIPARSINHKIYINIADIAQSKYWKKIKNKKGSIEVVYKLIERY
jgi:hypothetical protein